MLLYLENGNYSSEDAIEDPDEEFMREEFIDEYFEFAILSDPDDDLTFIQFAVIGDTRSCTLDYQDGSTDRHYTTEKPVSFARATSALIWYLRGDTSWKTEFVWERIAI